MKTHLFAILLLLCGCDVSVRRNGHPSTNTPVVAPTNVVVSLPVPEIDSPVGTGDKIDPATISPTNIPYILDMNGDGIADAIQLRVGTVYFRNKQTEPEVPILVIKMDIIAYRIEPNAIYFYDTNRNGYVQRKLGINRGLPYFGNMENQ